MLINRNLLNQNWPVHAMVGRQGPRNQERSLYTITELLPRYWVSQNVCLDFPNPNKLFLSIQYISKLKKKIHTKKSNDLNMLFFS